MRTGLRQLARVCSGGSGRSLRLLGIELADGDPFRDAACAIRKDDCHCGTLRCGPRGVIATSVLQVQARSELRFAGQAWKVRTRLRYDNNARAFCWHTKRADRPVAKPLQWQERQKDQDQKPARQRWHCWPAAVRKKAHAFVGATGVPCGGR